jgi:RNA polymerase sigma-70 factor, ECF subfamily
MTAASIAETGPETRRGSLAGAPRRRKPTRAERRLAAALKRRDPASLHRLYEEYGGTTYGFLVGILRDHHAAQDVQQQVFLEAWQRARTFDPARASLLTWLMTIARSRAIDHLRKRVPEPKDPAGSLGAEQQADPHSELDRLADAHQVAHFLSRLPGEEADILRMRFYEDLSQREIADRTGLPLGTVKMRMAQALERLRTQLNREEVLA